MKRHPSIVVLSRDHQKGLMLAQLLKKDAPLYKGLPTDIEGKMNYAKETFQNDLIQHFSDEEKILFPSVKGRDTACDQLIRDLCDEHKYFREKIPSLKNSNELADELNIIGYKLEEHIRKEERVLFNLIQNLLDETELEDVKLKIEKSRENFTKACKKNKI